MDGGADASRADRTPPREEGRHLCLYPRTGRTDTVEGGVRTPSIPTGMSGRYECRRVAEDGFEVFDSEHGLRWHAWLLSEHPEMTLDEAREFAEGHTNRLNLQDTIEGFDPTPVGPRASG